MQQWRTSPVRIGEVADLADPLGLRRVRVRYTEDNSDISDWAWLVSPMAGPKRGFHFRPMPGDEVLTIDCGEYVFVLGAMWSKADPPPPDDGDQAANNWRFIRSRSGHVVKLDDTAGAEKIELIDKDEQRLVVIDSANAKIQVLCKQGDVEVTASNGTVTIHASGDMTLSADGAIAISGKQGVTIDAGQSDVKVSGSTINLN